MSAQSISELASIDRVDQLKMKMMFSDTVSDILVHCN